MLFSKPTKETAKPILMNNISHRVSPPEVRNFESQFNDFTISRGGGKSPQKSPQNWPKLAFFSQIGEVVK